jgi:hypothetical protein
LFAGKIRHPATTGTPAVTPCGCESWAPAGAPNELIAEGPAPAEHAEEKKPRHRAHSASLARMSLGRLPSENGNRTGGIQYGKMRFSHRVLLIAWTISLAACGSPARTNEASNEPSPIASVQSVAGHDFKPGTHAAEIVGRLQRLRVKHPERFLRLLAAYEASHGDVNHPAMVGIRNEVTKWLAIGQTDYANMPAYLKTFAGSGPYRRLITKPGFSYVSGTVSLPCKAAHLRPNFEVAFAYVGGWGVGSAGTAVDAGFQRSNAFDDYAAFIRAQGYPQISKEPRFPCGHSVDFAFSAVTDTDLRLWTKGYTENHKVEVVVADLNHVASYGWPSGGGGTANGIVLKRMTTIGQNDPEKNLPPGVAWNQDGSYFGRLPGDHKPMVHWTNLKVGQVGKNGAPINLVPWGLDQTDETANAGTRNYPENAYNIWFTCTGCPNESDAINLVK